MTRIDREAVIARFRAKELRKIADARSAHDDYSAGLAAKRLDRVNEMAKSFTEVDKEGWHAA